MNKPTQAELRQAFQVLADTLYCFIEEEGQRDVVLVPLSQRETRKCWQAVDRKQLRKFLTSFLKDVFQPDKPAKPPKD